MQKRMFKVLGMVPKHNGPGTNWIRLGTGFTNRDDSINIYLDAMPRNFELQIRELDEEDLRKRDPSETQAPGASTANQRTQPPMTTNPVTSAPLG